MRFQRLYYAGSPQHCRKCDLNDIFAFKQIGECINGGLLIFHRAIEMRLPGWYTFDSSHHCRECDLALPSTIEVSRDQ